MLSEDNEPGVNPLQLVDSFLAICKAEVAPVFKDEVDLKIRLMLFGAIFYGSDWYFSFLGMG
jgi:hypothetical protein